ncbi:hypothetical protein ACFLT9_10525, partial [Acidobacteriota bacterium]
NAAMTLFGLNRLWGLSSGQKGEIIFTVTEFIENTAIARTLTFRHPSSEGKIKILSVGFNTPFEKGVFSQSMLERYKRQTWAEIQELLKKPQ